MFSLSTNSLDSLDYFLLWWNILNIKSFNLCNIYVLSLNLKLLYYNLNFFPCMLKKGEYTVIDILCVSNSLLEQMNSEEEHKSSLYSVYKSVLESKDYKGVAYLLGEIQVGQSSIIYIHADMEIPLLYKEDYKIVKQTTYSTNKKLIDKLLNKKI